jgi:hypothetical protein
MNKPLLYGLAAVSFVVAIVPAFADPLSFDPVQFDPAPVGSAISATGAAVAYQTNPMIGDDYEITWEARAEPRSGSSARPPGSE